MRMRIITPKEQNKSREYAATSELEWFHTLQNEIVDAAWRGTSLAIRDAEIGGVNEARSFVRILCLRTWIKRLLSRLLLWKSSRSVSGDHSSAGAVGIPRIS